MGNKLGRRRQVVDERYTRPQGLYIHKDVDHKKLRKLILESKLAPCYPGDEENSCCDHEECPICFLYYPSLNRSRCCLKGICTECFLQMKNPNSTRPTQCPFCKTLYYAVEYCGVKTKEEKGLEQIEEQRVIEAKIRMRQQELRDDEDRTQKRLESSSSSTGIAPGDVDCGSTAAPSSRSPMENEETASARHSIRYPPPSGGNRDDEFDLDLEDVMVMEAMWLSIQEHGKQKSAPYNAAASSEQCAIQANCVSPVMASVMGSSSSPSGGLACAVAALAERQQMSGESSSHDNTGNIPGFNSLPRCSTTYNRVDQGAENYPPIHCSSNISRDCTMELTRDDGQWGGSDAPEAGTSYASSDTAENAVLPPPPPPLLPLGDEPSPIVPESFEEQMMLAMAVSLAEARTMTTLPGSRWQ